MMNGLPSAALSGRHRFIALLYVIKCSAHVNVYLQPVLDCFVYSLVRATGTFSGGQCVSQ